MDKEMHHYHIFAIITSVRKDWGGWRCRMSFKNLLQLQTGHLYFATNIITIIAGDIILPFKYMLCVSDAICKSNKFSHGSKM